MTSSKWFACALAREAFISSGILEFGETKANKPGTLRRTPFSAAAPTAQHTQQKALKMWYLSRNGSSEGPLAESRIVDLIRNENLRDGHICVVGENEWQPLQSHRAFADALNPAASATNIGNAATAFHDAVPGTLAHAPTAFGAVTNAPFAVPSVAGNTQLAQGYGPPQTAVGYGTPTQAQGYGAAHQAQGYSGPGQAQGYGAPPQAQGYGGPGQAQGYGAPPQAQGYGAPQQAQAYPQGVPATQLSAATKRKFPLGLALGGGGALGALVIGGGALGYFLMRSPAPALAKALPAKTQIYVEVTGVKQTVLALKKIDFIDGNKYDDKKAMDEAQTSLANAFALPKDASAKIALGLGGLAVGAWDVENKPEAVLLISWDSSAAAELLLTSKRFTAAGTVGDGTAYTLARREITGDDLRKLPEVEKLLSKLETKADDKLAWFPKSKIIALGNEAGVLEVSRVLAGTSVSLAKSDLYAAAKKQFNSGAQMVGFVDPMVAKKSTRDIFDKLIGAGNPMTLSANAEGPGIRIKYTMELAGTEVTKQKTLAFPEVSSLSLGKTLPKETFALAQFATKPGKRGKEGRDELLALVARNLPEGSGRLSRQIEEGEKQVGVEIGDVLNMLGDEAVIGLLARDGYRLERNASPNWKDFAVVYGQKLEDEAAAKRVVATLKGQAARMVKITSDGDDFVGEPEREGRDIPRVAVRYIKKELVVVLGARDLADKAFAAAAGKDSLADDKSYRAATDATEGRNQLFWVDTGRIAQTMLDANSKLKEAATKAGLPVDAFVLLGSKRMTSTLGITMKRDGERVLVTADSINLPFASGIAGAYFYIASSSSLDDLAQHTDDTDDDPPANHAPSRPTAIGDALPKACEDYLSHYQRCMTPLAGRAQTEKTINAIREGYTNMKMPSVVAGICERAEAEVTKSFPKCN
jgi:hypothetical protein